MQNNRPAKKANSPNAYTLIELSIVLLVGSMLSFLLYNALINPNEQSNYLNTIKKMEKIEAKLLEFLSEEGRLPCPAAPLLAKDNSGYGLEYIEYLSNAPARCRVDEGVKSNVVSPTAVYQGSVPVYTLGLDGNYMADDYGNQFTYVVTRSYANSESSNQICSPLPIKQPTGSVTSQELCFVAERGAVNLHSNFLKLYGVFEPSSESGNFVQGVAYILISYGENSGGAFLKDATTQDGRRVIDSDTSKATYLNLGCSTSGACNGQNLLNQGQYVLNSAPETGAIFTDIVKFGHRNNMVVRCNQKFNGKCSNNLNLDIR